MFYKQLCATRRTHPPVKTFRTAAPVCQDDGVSHVPPFVFPETALGNCEMQPDAVFGNGATAGLVYFAGYYGDKWRFLSDIAQSLSEFNYFLSSGKLTTI